MSQPPHSDNTSRATNDDDRAPDAAPTGLTHREQQRRRIVIAGLTTPTLMTLPSRRAWSAACSKSKLKKLSGALSAKKTVDPMCDNIGCTSAFWQDGTMWPTTTHGVGAPMPTDTFAQWFLAGFMNPMFVNQPTLLQVLQLDGAILDKDSNNNNTVYKKLNNQGELELLNKEAAAALCNAFYLNNMNFIVGFHIAGTSGYADPPGTSPMEIVAKYEMSLNTSIGDGNHNAIRMLRMELETENNAIGGCPIA